MNECYFEKVAERKLNPTAKFDWAVVNAICLEPFKTHLYVHAPVACASFTMNIAHILYAFVSGDCKGTQGLCRRLQLYRGMINAYCDSDARHIITWRGNVPEI
jgi:hypothetical protein